MTAIEEIFGDPDDGVHGVLSGSSRCEYRDDMLSCLDRIGAGQPPVLQMRLEPQIAA